MFTITLVCHREWNSALDRNLFSSVSVRPGSEWHCRAWVSILRWVRRSRRVEHRSQHLVSCTKWNRVWGWEPPFLRWRIGRSRNLVMQCGRILHIVFKFVGHLLEFFLAFSCQALVFIVGSIERWHMPFEFLIHFFQFLHLKAYIAFSSYDAQATENGNDCRGALLVFHSDHLCFDSSSSLRLGLTFDMIADCSYFNDWISACAMFKSIFFCSSRPSESLFASFNDLKSDSHSSIYKQVEGNDGVCP